MLACNRPALQAVDATAGNRVQQVLRRARLRADVPAGGCEATVQGFDRSPARRPVFGFMRFSRVRKRCILSIYRIPRGS